MNNPSVPLRRILAAAIVGLLAILAVGSLPSSVEARRSVFVRAPAANVHARITDLEGWKIRAGGGESMTVTARNPESGVWYDLHTDGWRLKGVILHEERDGGTDVTAILRGDLGSNPVRRLSAVFVESALEEDLEQNLERVRALIEGR